MEFFAICAGVPVHISDTKSGSKTLVLLHGYLETLSVWDDFVPLLDKDLRIIRIDLPGHGLSGAREPVTTVDFSAQAVYEALQKCGVEACTVVGHSMGGYVALSFAEQFPDAVNGLCLFHSTPHPDPETKREARDREIAFVREGKLPLIVSQSVPNMFADDNAARFKTKIEEIIEVSEIHEPDGIAACLEGMKIRPDRNGFLADFKKPLLFIFGRKDRHIPIETAEALAAKFPHADVLWLPDAGHCGFVEAPQDTAEKISRFVV
ncbi:MAG: alpha/beta hydrolase [Prevotellaceae bacterium]|jgi:pimeloyl-ACP methyl ester carboxylesterase|nr:alpha/beta hydrolase [Prevotellaceae bacterium]